MRLLSPFPNPDELYAALLRGTRNGREIFARLWLTEGPPFAFRECPAIYEELRGWLGSRLRVHPKEITVIGSARIGYSLAPAPEFGRPFGNHSDLDISIVSSDLFRRLIAAYKLFADDYRQGTVAPRSARERTLWNANLEFAERVIPRGFFDAAKVPTFDRYPDSQRINNAMWALIKKLEATNGAPKLRRASTRVYRDWESFIERASLNLQTTLVAVRRLGL